VETRLFPNEGERKQTNLPGLKKVPKIRRGLSMGGRRGEKYSLFP